MQKLRVKLLITSSPVSPSSAWNRWDGFFSRGCCVFLKVSRRSFVRLMSHSLKIIFDNLPKKTCFERKSRNDNRPYKHFLQTAQSSGKMYQKKPKSREQQDLKLFSYALDSRCPAHIHDVFINNRNKPGFERQRLPQILSWVVWARHCSGKQFWSWAVDCWRFMN